MNHPGRVLRWRLSLSRSGKGLWWFISNNVMSVVQTADSEKQGRRFRLWGPWQRPQPSFPFFVKTWHDAWHKKKFSITICWLELMGDHGYKDTFSVRVSSETNTKRIKTIIFKCVYLVLWSFLSALTNDCLLDSYSEKNPLKRCHYCFSIMDGKAVREGKSLA